MSKLIAFIVIVIVVQMNNNNKLEIWVIDTHEWLTFAIRSRRRRRRHHHRRNKIEKYVGKYPLFEFNFVVNSIFILCLCREISKFEKMEKWE